MLAHRDGLKMGDVVDIDTHRPHQVGHALCRACKYVHISVIIASASETSKNYQVCPRCEESEAAFMTYDELAAAGIDQIK